MVLMKNKRIKVLSSILCIAVIILAVCIYIDNNTFKVTTYIEKNTSYDALNNVTFLQISDLHNQEFGKNNEDLIKTIDDIKPNYIFMTGDMVSAEDNDFNGFYHLVDGIASKYQCFYVVGNHELGLSKKKYNEMIDYMEKHGIIFLDNKAFSIDKDIFIYGLNYSSKFYLNKKYTKKEMDKDLGVANDDAFNILLAHNPNDFDTYNEWGADLVFSGHTHGGMISLFGIGIISPSRNLFPEYDGGEYTINDSIMINSKGMSRGHIGFRLFNRPELIVVKY